MLRGRLPVWVEGRRYELGRLDAIYIPQTSAAEGGRTAHLSWNDTDQNMMFLWLFQAASCYGNSSMKARFLQSARARTTPSATNIVQSSSSPFRK